MTRTLPLFALLAPLVTGCIIYEERHHRGNDGRCVDEDGEVVEPDDCGEIDVPNEVDPDPEPEPEPEEPTATDLLTLTVNEGQPGQTLLSTLIPLSQDIDLSSVASIGFERDVQVLDTISRPYELVLLLSIDADAELGDVAVFVETTQGTGWVLSDPFHLVAGDGSAPTCTGGTTTDTGC